MCCLLRVTCRIIGLVNDDRSGLYAYLGVSAAVALVSGILAMYYMPVVDILLRTVAGGFVLVSFGNHLQQ